MSRRLPVIAAVAAGLMALLAAPAAVLGHTLNSTYESQLPLAAYLAGAALAVGLSFAFVLLRDIRAEPPDTGVPSREPPAVLRVALRAIGLAAWLWILAQGVVGGTSDADVASLFVWIYTWVGVAIVSAFVGPIWFYLDPFSTLHDIAAWVLERLGVQGWAMADYPAWLGRWPAVVGFAFVVWLELVMKGATGRTLFVAIVGYSALTLAMMAQFGRDQWRANGEVFSVWFRLIGRLAPIALADEDGRLRRRPFAGGLLEPGWTLADVVLVALGIGSILFDGLSQTTPWYDAFGFPAAPLATVQLAAFLAVVIVAVLAVSRLVGIAATGAGFLPIAVGYLVAHYFTYLVVDGQRIAIAVSDPLQQGQDLFGSAFFEPSSGFLVPGLVWTLQLVAVVGGHMVGAWGGHVTAARQLPGDARQRQIPLAAVMVCLTTLTLWSLGQTIVQQPATTSATPLASAHVDGRSP